MVWVLSCGCFHAGAFMRVHSCGCIHAGAFMRVTSTTAYSLQPVHARISFVHRLFPPLPRSASPSPARPLTYSNRSSRRRPSASLRPSRPTACSASPLTSSPSAPSSPSSPPRWAPAWTSRWRPGLWTCPCCRTCCCCPLISCPLPRYGGEGDTGGDTEKRVCLVYGEVERMSLWGYSTASC